MKGSEQEVKPLISFTISPAKSRPAGDTAACNQTMREGLNLLMQARTYSRELGQNVWDFAVEIQFLTAVGLCFNDLRWLIFRGYLEHARECTRLADDIRTFGPPGKCIFNKRSCFVLTEAGIAFAQSHFLNNNGYSKVEAPFWKQIAEDSSSNNGVVPRWDCDLREFRYHGQLIKQFKLPSPNQEAILMTFEEDRWARRIDDPLSPSPNCDTKQRLHDTIRSLNRNQKIRLIRFKGDGTGEGVLWEPILDLAQIDDD